MFDDPLTVDFTRPDAAQSMVFGTGIHRWASGHVPGTGCSHFGFAGCIHVAGVRPDEVDDVAALLHDVYGDSSDNPVRQFLLDALGASRVAEREVAQASALFPLPKAGSKLAATTARRITRDIEHCPVNERLGAEADYLAAYPVSRATLRGHGRPAFMRRLFPRGHALVFTHRLNMGHLTDIR